MSIVTFLNKEKLTAVSDKLVYTGEESLDLQTLFVKASKLADLLESEEARIEAAREKAYETGYEQGQSEGYEAALGHIAVKLIELAKEADEMRDKMERKTGELALQIVTKIAEDIGTPETLAALAASAAKQLVPREPVILRVSVSNLEKVREVVLASANFNSRISEVTGDPGLQFDDCILETEYGQIKANLQTQLDALKEHFNTYG